MRKTFLNLGVFVLLSTSVGAQVKDISFAVAPTGDYVWWQKKTAITNGFMAGGYVGFGFGRNIELLGSYRQSIGMKSTLTGYDAPNAISNIFESKEVAVHRWGGELKGNIPMAYSFQPYVTLGSGVQTIKANDLSQDQVYFALGLGAKFNLARRLTLNLQAKATRFSFDPSNVLYKPTEANTSAYNTWINNNVDEENHLAWSVGAGLQLYFGGLALGVDFTEYIGIRGYYHQAMTEGKLSTKFDKLSMYGGDFLARLNVANGVVPYVQLGAGYMRVGDDYVGKVASVANKSGIFAKGGIGLAIPLGKRVELFGVANLLYTTHNKDVSTALSAINELQSNVFYNAGIRIKLAKKVEREVYGEPKEVTAVATTPVSPEKQKLTYYNSQITIIEKQIQLAYQNGDTANANRLLKEKQQWEDLRNTYVAEHQPYPTAEQVRLVRMTPEELQQLIDNVVKSIKEGEGKTPEQRIDRLEKLLLEAQKAKDEVQNTKTVVPTAE